MFKSNFIFLVPVFFFILSLAACGEDHPYFGGSFNESTSESAPSDYSYAVESTGRIGKDLHTIVVEGRVTGSSTNAKSAVTKASLNFPVTVSIVQLSSNLSKKQKTDDKGYFSADFEIMSPAFEDFEIAVLDKNSSPLSQKETVAVDLTGDWEGPFSIDQKEGDCERVPILSSLNTDVRVEQDGYRFKVYLGGYLNFFPIAVTVDKKLNVSGSGSIGIPSSLTSYTGCYSSIAYEFGGTVDTDVSPATFDVTFDATLSGVSKDCESPPESDCTLQGTLKGKHQP